MRQDILDDTAGQGQRWDSIVISEVLEHLEEPERALRNVASLLADDGRILITTPVNCPMPDHIYLFRTPEEVLELVAAAGLEVMENTTFATLGMTEEKARKRKLPIACAIIARKAA